MHARVMTHLGARSRRVTEVTVSHRSISTHQHKHMTCKDAKSALSNTVANVRISPCPCSSHLSSGYAQSCLKDFF